MVLQEIYNKIRFIGGCWASLSFIPDDIIHFLNGAIVFNGYQCNETKDIGLACFVCRVLERITLVLLIMDLILTYFVWYLKGYYLAT